MKVEEALGTSTCVRERSDTTSVPENPSAQTFASALNPHERIQGVSAFRKQMIYEQRTADAFPPETI
jgi:hypothetical protein